MSRSKSSPIIKAFDFRMTQRWNPFHSSLTRILHAEATAWSNRRLVFYHLSESSRDAQISGPRLCRSPAAAARLRRTAGTSPDSRYGSRAAAGPPDTAALLWMRLRRAARASNVHGLEIGDA